MRGSTSSVLMVGYLGVSGLVLTLGFGDGAGDLVCGTVTHSATVSGTVSLSNVVTGTATLEDC